MSIMYTPDGTKVNVSEDQLEVVIAAGYTVEKPVKKTAKEVKEEKAEAAKEAKAEVVKEEDKTAPVRRKLQ